MGQVESVVVYVIITNHSTFYTGITNSLIRRWSEHVRGQSSYLRRVRPKGVVFVEFWPSRREAAVREKYIKRMGAKKFLMRIKFGKEVIFVT